MVRSLEKLRYGSSEIDGRDDNGVATFPKDAVAKELLFFQYFAQMLRGMNRTTHPYGPILVPPATFAEPPLLRVAPENLFTFLDEHLDNLGCSNLQRQRHCDDAAYRGPTDQIEMLGERTSRFLFE